MIPGTLFKQAWWVSLAVVLAGLQIVLAIGIGADSEATVMERFVISVIWGGSALLAILGAFRRPRHRRLGDALIAVGVIPAVIGGMIFFWFPPLWVTTAMGMTVMWSSLRDAFAPVDHGDLLEITH